MNNMAAKQLIGWFLVLLGILLIICALYDSFNIFTGSKSAPEIFSAEQSSSAVAKPAGSPEAQAPTPNFGGAGQAQELVGQMLQEQLHGLLPADSITSSLNLVSWSMLA